jgi:hypothetical protein
MIAPLAFRPRSPLATNEPLAVVELSPTEAAPVLKGALASFPAMIKSYFDVTLDSPLEAYEREALCHPMFRVVAKTTAMHP